MKMPALIRQINASTIDGKQLKVRAKHFVLACGAIENARLLLISNDVETGGVGNSNDQVGRYFMEHPHGRIAYIKTDDPAWFWAQYRKRYPQSRPTRGTGAGGITNPAKRKEDSEQCRHFQDSAQTGTRPGDEQEGVFEPEAQFVRFRS